MLTILIQLTPPAMTTVLPILAQAWPHLISFRDLIYIQLDPIWFWSNFMRSNECGFGLIKPKLPISVKTIPFLKLPSGRIVLSHPGPAKQTISIAWQKKRFRKWAKKSLTSYQEKLLLRLKEDAAHSIVRGLLRCPKQDRSSLKNIQLSHESF